MKFRFSLRTLLIVMTLAGVATYWVALPVFEQRAEARNMAALEKLVQPAVGDVVLPGQAMAVAPFFYDKFVPSKLRNTFRNRIFSEDVFERIVRVRLDGVVLTPEIVSRLSQLKYLETISLNDTSLNDEQCRLLAALPNLRTLDCAGTPVTYETLLDCRRKYPRICHLAHRRAVAELGRRTVGVYPYNRKNAPKNAVYVALGAPQIDADVLKAIKYLGRPVGEIYVATSDLLAPTFDELGHTRSDFKINLNFHHRPNRQDGQPVLRQLTQDQFQRFAWDRIAKIDSSFVEVEEWYDIGPAPIFESLIFNAVGPNFLRSFSHCSVHRFVLYGLDLDRYDRNVIPGSVRELQLFCVPGEIDLSHCKAVEVVGLNGDWTRKQLLSLLESPSIKEVQLASAKRDAEVVRIYAERGVKFTHCQPMWAPQTPPHTIR